MKLLQIAVFTKLNETLTGKLVIIDKYYYNPSTILCQLGTAKVPCTWNVDAGIPEGMGRQENGLQFRKWE